MVRPTINSQKHYIQNSIFSVASGGITPATLISAVNVVDKNLAHEVEEGSIIKAIYLEYWISCDDVVGGSCIVAIEKLMADSTGLEAGTIAGLDAYTNKKNVLQVFMGLTPQKDGFPMSVFKGWLKIPKSKQRFGLGDQLKIHFFAQSDGLIGCGFSTYKEYK